MAICFLLNDQVVFVFIVIITIVRSVHFTQILPSLKEDTKNSVETNSFISNVLKYKPDLEWIERLHDIYKANKISEIKGEKTPGLPQRLIRNSPYYPNNNRNPSQLNFEKTRKKYSPYIEPYNSDDINSDRNKRAILNNRQHFNIGKNGVRSFGKLYNGLERRKFKRKQRSDDTENEKTVINIAHEKKLQQESQDASEDHYILGLQNFISSSNVDCKKSTYGQHRESSLNLVYPKHSEYSLSRFNSNQNINDVQGDSSTVVVPNDKVFQQFPTVMYTTNKYDFGTTSDSWKNCQSSQTNVGQIEQNHLPQEPTKLDPSSALEQNSDTGLDSKLNGIIEKNKLSVHTKTGPSLNGQNIQNQLDTKLKEDIDLSLKLSDQSTYANSIQNDKHHNLWSVHTNGDPPLTEFNQEGTKNVETKTVALIDNSFEKSISDPSSALEQNSDTSLDSKSNKIIKKNKFSVYTKYNPSFNGQNNQNQLETKLNEPIDPSFKQLGQLTSNSNSIQNDQHQFDDNLWSLHTNGDPSLNNFNHEGTKNVETKTVSLKDNSFESSINELNKKNEQLLHLTSASETDRNGIQTNSNALESKDKYHNNNQHDAKSVENNKDTSKFFQLANLAPSNSDSHQFPIIRIHPSFNSDAPNHLIQLHTKFTRDSTSKTHPRFNPEAPRNMIHSKNYPYTKEVSGIYFNDTPESEDIHTPSLSKDVETYVAEKGPPYLTHIPHPSKNGPVLKFEFNPQKSMEDKAAEKGMTEAEMRRAEKEAHKLMAVDTEFHERNEPESVKINLENATKWEEKKSVLIDANFDNSPQDDPNLIQEGDTFKESLKESEENSSLDDNKQNLNTQNLNEMDAVQDQSLNESETDSNFNDSNMNRYDNIEQEPSKGSGEDSILEEYKQDSSEPNLKEIKKILNVHRPKQNVDGKQKSSKKSKENKIYNDNKQNWEETKKILNRYDIIEQEPSKSSGEDSNLEENIQDSSEPNLEEIKKILNVPRLKQKLDSKQISSTSSKGNEIFVDIKENLNLPPKYVINNSMSYQDLNCSISPDYAKIPNDNEENFNSEPENENVKTKISDGIMFKRRSLNFYLDSLLDHAKKSKFKILPNYSRELPKSSYKTRFLQFYNTGEEYERNDFKRSIKNYDDSDFDIENKVVAGLDYENGIFKPLKKTVQDNVKKLKHALGIGDEKNYNEEVEDIYPFGNTQENIPDFDYIQTEPIRKSRNQPKLLEKIDENHLLPNVDLNKQVSKSSVQKRNEGGAKDPCSNRDYDDDDDCYVKQSKRKRTEGGAKDPCSNRDYDDDDDCYVKRSKQKRTEGGAKDPCSNRDYDDDDDCYVKRSKHKRTEGSAKNPCSNSDYDDDDDCYVKQSKQKRTDGGAKDPCSNRDYDDDDDCYVKRSKHKKIKNKRDDIVEVTTTPIPTPSISSTVVNDVSTDDELKKTKSNETGTTGSPGGTNIIENQNGTGATSNISSGEESVCDEQKSKNTKSNETDTTVSAGDTNIIEKKNETVATSNISSGEEGVCDQHKSKKTTFNETDTTVSAGNTNIIEKQNGTGATSNIFSDEEEDCDVLKSKKNKSIETDTTVSAGDTNIIENQNGTGATSNISSGEENVCDEQKSKKTKSNETDTTVSAGDTNITEKQNGTVATSNISSGEDGACDQQKSNKPKSNETDTTVSAGDTNITEKQNGTVATSNISSGEDGACDQQNSNKTKSNETDTTVSAGDTNTIEKQNETVGTSNIFSDEEEDCTACPSTVVGNKMEKKESSSESIITTHVTTNTEPTTTTNNITTTKLETNTEPTTTTYNTITTKLATTIGPTDSTTPTNTPAPITATEGTILTTAEQIITTDKCTKLQPTLEIGSTSSHINQMSSLVPQDITQVPVQSTNVPEYSTPELEQKINTVGTHAPGYTSPHITTTTSQSSNSPSPEPVTKVDPVTFSPILTTKPINTAKNLAGITVMASNTTVATILAKGKTKHRLDIVAMNATECMVEETTVKEEVAEVETIGEDLKKANEGSKLAPGKRVAPTSTTKINAPDFKECSTAPICDNCLTTPKLLVKNNFDKNNRYFSSQNQNLGIFTRKYNRNIQIPLDKQKRYLYPKMYTNSKHPDSRLHAKSNRKLLNHSRSRYYQESNPRFKRFSAGRHHPSPSIKRIHNLFQTPVNNDNTNPMPLIRYNYKHQHQKPRQHHNSFRFRTLDNVDGQKYKRYKITKHFTPLSRRMNVKHLRSANSDLPKHMDEASLVAKKVLVRSDEPCEESHDISSAIVDHIFAAVHSNNEMQNNFGKSLKKNLMPGKPLGASSSKTADNASGLDCVMAEVRQSVSKLISGRTSGGGSSSSTTCQALDAATSNFLKELTKNQPFNTISGNSGPGDDTIPGQDTYLFQDNTSQGDKTCEEDHSKGSASLTASGHLAANNNIETLSQDITSKNGIVKDLMRQYSNLIKHDQENLSAVYKYLENQSSLLDSIKRGARRISREPHSFMSRHQHSKESLPPIYRRPIFTLPSKFNNNQHIVWAQDDTSRSSGRLVKRALADRRKKDVDKIFYNFDRNINKLDEFMSLPSDGVEKSLIFNFESV